jgi:hypothetical protein
VKGTHTPPHLTARLVLAHEVHASSNDPYRVFIHSEARTDILRGSHTAAAAIKPARNYMQQLLVSMFALQLRNLAPPITLNEVDVRSVLYQGFCTFSVAHLGCPHQGSATETILCVLYVLCVCMCVHVCVRVCVCVYVCLSMNMCVFMCV